MSGNSITKFANSLTDYLVDAMTDKYGDAKSFRYKYNNLKVYMDPKRVSDPHFFVMVGISEALFSVDDGKKLDGGLGGSEDACVKKWAERKNIQSELKEHWKVVKEAFITEMKEEELKRQAMTIVRMKRVESEELKVDMTGTGINRAKRKEMEAKRKHLAEFKKQMEEKHKKDKK